MFKVLFWIFFTPLVSISIGFFGGWAVVHQRFLCENCELGSLLSSFEQTSSTKIKEGKLIVLAIDGVPYNVFSKLQKNGHFGSFRASSKLIAPFPSLTKLSFSQILGGEVRPGYERVYYDATENRLKESYNVLEHLFVFKNKVPAISFLGSPGYVGYAVPHAFKKGFFEGIKKRILSAKKDHFFGYTSISDFLSHRDGKAELQVFLLELEKLIMELKAELGEKTRFILFSDHGNSLKKGKLVDLNPFLKEFGFSQEKNLNEKQDYVLPLNGLVGVATIHTLSSKKGKMCDAILNSRGVDLCMYSDSDQVIIRKKDGSKASLKKDRKGFIYQVDTEDPLKIIGNEKIKHLSFQGWWDKTKEHSYPDPLHRIWQGFHGLVQNPAQILVSLKDGYTVGPKLLSLPLSWSHHKGGTHGGLQETQTNGFFVTDFSNLDTHLRAEWVYKLLRQATQREELSVR